MNVLVLFTNADYHVFLPSLGPKNVEQVRHMERLSCDKRE